MENENSQKAESKVSRRKRRAERNKSRTVRHITKLLDNFESEVMEGYTHSSWTNLAAIHRQLSPFLSPEEYHELGRVWSETWMGPVNYDDLVAITTSIKERIEYGS